MTDGDELDGLLIVDKSAGPTSHDVVGVARRALRTRAIGHTGTLDPMATGVLILAIGEATKLVSMLGASQKRYRTTIALGRSTTTLDREGDVDGEAPVPAHTLASVQRAAERFVGEHDQRAPRVSAIKVEGRSLYKRARTGEQFEAPLRRVRLDAVSIDAFRGDHIDATLTCGAGFYVRAFARDLAAALGTLGHLTSLRRVANGNYSVEQAVSFEQLREARAKPDLAAELRARVLSLEAVCATLPHVQLDDAGVANARHGRRITTEQVADGAASLAATVVALDAQGVPVALIERDESGHRVLRGFRAR